MKNAKNTAAELAVETTILSSGNPFRDLGLSNPEERLFKSNLALEVRRLIKERDLTQQEIAEILGIDQPKVSRLLRGQLSGFSVEKLFLMLNKLGRKVEVRISEEGYAPQDADLTVSVG
ncbi:XRE family transcriptional regulator [bacterium]|nr:MAG: XRE family transcriptional regulator [bacterium]